MSKITGRTKLGKLGKAGFALSIGARRNFENAVYADIRPDVEKKEQGMFGTKFILLSSLKVVSAESGFIESWRR